jgi:hypothetical protein
LDDSSRTAAGVGRRLAAAGTEGSRKCGALALAVRASSHFRRRSVRGTGTGRRCAAGPRVIYVICACTSRAGPPKSACHFGGLVVLWFGKAIAPPPHRGSLGFRKDTAHLFASRPCLASAHSGKPMPLQGSEVAPPPSIEAWRASDRGGSGIKAGIKGPVCCAQRSTKGYLRTKAALRTPRTVAYYNGLCTHPREMTHGRACAWERGLGQPAHAARPRGGYTLRPPRGGEGAERGCVSHGSWVSVVLLVLAA